MTEWSHLLLVLHVWYVFIKSRDSRVKPISSWLFLQQPRQTQEREEGTRPDLLEKKCCKHSRAVISEFDHWLSRSWLAVDVRFMCTEALKSSDAVLPRQEMKSTGNDHFQLDLHEDQKVALMFCKLFGFILKKRDFIFGKFWFFFFW